LDKFCINSVLNPCYFYRVFSARNNARINYVQHGFSCIDLSMSTITYSQLILHDKVI